MSARRRGGAALLLALAPLSAHAEEPSVWLGHTAVMGERTMPVLGQLQTRTDTWVIAQVQDHGDHLIIEQTACDMQVKPVAGVRVAMAAQAVQRLPRATFRLDRQGDGTLVGAPWQTGWGSEDVDADGAPGATVRVRAALCGGQLQVASATESTATATRSEGLLRGRLDVEVGQTILGADGACLRVAAKDSVERMGGPFAYVPAPAGATCASLGREAWPDAEALSTEALSGPGRSAPPPPPRAEG